MIDVEKEPKEITQEFRGLLENCYFCRQPTTFWFQKRTPVCEACAKKHDVSEIKKARND